MTVAYPMGKLRLLGNQTQPKMRSHDIICLHTMVGYLTSTDTMFKANGYGGLESHFGVGGKWGPDAGKSLDGTVYQWQDPTYTADANLDGNHRVISIETADNAPRSADDIEPWTQRQLDAIVDLVAWLCKRYDIPAELIKDTKPGRRGIAYHRQGCRHSQGLGVPGFLVAGGEKWSASVGKVCPGTRRIAQLQNIVIPRVKAQLSGKNIEKEEEEMPFTEKDAELFVKTLLGTEVPISEAEAAEMDNAGIPRKKGDKISLRYFLGWGGAGSFRNYGMLLALQKSVAGLSAKKLIEEPDAETFRASAPVVTPAGGVAAWSPQLRHLLVLLIGFGLSWLTTDLVPFLSGQTGYGALLAALISAAVAYFTPLVPSYGIGKPVGRYRASRNVTPLD